MMIAECPLILVKHVRCSLQILGYFDYAFTAIFTVEIVLKVNVLPCAGVVCGVCAVTL